MKRALPPCSVIAWTVRAPRSASRPETTTAAPAEASSRAVSNPEARLAVASGFLRWESAIQAGLRAMHARGELNADPDDLALATLAALQGGLLLTQLQRRVKPLEVALDAAIDHIAQHTRPR